MKNKLYLFVLLSFALLGFFVYQNAKFSDGKLHVVFCNVGQGDAIYIRTPKGSDILIDGGSDDSVLKCLSNNMPFYDRDLELVFMSHPDLDHFGGFIEVFKRYKVISFNTSDIKKDSTAINELNRLLKEKQIKKRFLSYGDNFKTSDGVTMKIIWPKIEDSISHNTISDENYFSLINLLSYEKLNILFTSDVDAEILNAVMSSQDQIDIVKIPHHGSKTGIDEKTFEFVKPAIAVISVGKNSYGHPAPKVLSLLKEKGIKILRTDKDGEVEIVADGEKFGVRSEK